MFRIIPALIIAVFSISLIGCTATVQTGGVTADERPVVKKRPIKKRPAKKEQVSGVEVDKRTLSGFKGKYKEAGSPKIAFVFDVVASDQVRAWAVGGSATAYASKLIEAFTLNFDNVGADTGYYVDIEQKADAKGKGKKKAEKKKVLWSTEEADIVVVITAVTDASSLTGYDFAARAVDVQSGVVVAEGYYLGAGLRGQITSRKRSTSLKLRGIGQVAHALSLELMDSLISIWKLSR